MDDDDQGIGEMLSAMRQWSYFPGFDPQPGQTQALSGVLACDTSLLDALSKSSTFLHLPRKKKVDIFGLACKEVQNTYPEQWSRKSTRWLQLLGFFFEIVTVVSPVTLGIDRYPYFPSNPESYPVSPFTLPD